MTKSKREKIRNAEFVKTGSASYAPRKYSLLDDDNERRMSEKIRKLYALRKNTVIQPQDVRPGDIIQIKKVRPKKRRSRIGTKWRVQYDDSSNGYVILTQVGWYNEKYAKKNKAYMDEHGFPILEIWNLSYGFAEYLIPRLKAYIELKRYTVPSELSDKYGGADNASDVWNAILMDIYQALCLYVQNKEGEELRTKLGYEASRKLEDKGLKLFQEYLYDIWD